MTYVLFVWVSAYRDWEFIVSSSQKGYVEEHSRKNYGGRIIKIIEIPHP